MPSNVPMFDPVATEKYIEEMFKAIGVDQRFIKKNINVTSNPVNPDTGTIDYDITLQVPGERTQVRFTGVVVIEAIRDPQP